MENLFAALVARLANEVPALKYCDEDWGQLDFYSEQPPVKFPCALVSLNQVAWSNTGKYGQTGLAVLKVRVADMKLSNSSHRAPQSQKDASGAIWGVLAAAYRALQGWRPNEATTALIRIATRRVRRDDGINLFEMEFSAQVTDNSARPPSYVAGPNLGVSLEAAFNSLSPTGV